MLISDTAVILATGSSPRSLPSISPDGKRVLNTDQILSISELPSSIGIIGGGVIGIEWASLLSDLGVAVTIFEVAPAILIHEDSDVQQEVAKQLTRRGITIKTETSVTKVEPEEHMVRVSYKPLAQDSEETLEFSHVLVCVGRKANIEGIGLEATEIAVKDGFVQVDEGFRTKEKHIYAIGDMIGGPMLAHVAAWQGMFVMQQLAGKKTLKDPAIPRCIYSRPEVASIGMNEQEAKERGFAVKVGMFPLRANGKALIHGDNQGFIKIIVDHKSDDLLGAHLVGYQATDLISLFSVGSVVDVSGWELSQAIYPHPTVAEAIGEAALDLGDGPIHA